MGFSLAPALDCFDGALGAILQVFVVKKIGMFAGEGGHDDSSSILCWMLWGDKGYLIVWSECLCGYLWKCMVVAFGASTLK